MNVKHSIFFSSGLPYRSIDTLTTYAQINKLIQLIELQPQIEKQLNEFAPSNFMTKPRACFFHRMFDVKDSLGVFIGRTRPGYSHAFVCQNFSFQIPTSLFLLTPLLYSGKSRLDFSTTKSKPDTYIEHA